VCCTWKLLFFKIFIYRRWGYKSWLWGEKGSRGVSFFVWFFCCFFLRFGIEEKAIVSVLVSFVCHQLRLNDLKKVSLKKQLHSATSVVIKAMRGCPIKCFCWIVFQGINPTECNLKNKWRGVRLKRVWLNCPISPNYYKHGNKKKSSISLSTDTTKINSGKEE
jgi:hypothetical protein